MSICVIITEQNVLNNILLFGGIVLLNYGSSASADHICYSNMLFIHSVTPRVNLKQLVHYLDVLGY